MKRPAPQTALGGAFRILEQVARAGAGVTTRDIVAATGMAPSTVYRLINQLAEEEYLERLPDLRGFALGRRVAELSESFGPTLTLSRAAHARLEQARADMRGGLHLVSYSNERVTVIDLDPDVPLFAPDVLHHQPERTAIGRLMLATAHTRHDTAAHAPTPPTLVETVRARGYAIQVDELRRGAGCLAVPLSDPDGRVLAALSLATSSGRLAEPDALAERLHRHGAELSALIV